MIGRKFSSACASISNASSRQQSKTSRQWPHVLDVAERTAQQDLSQMATRQVHIREDSTTRRAASVYMSSV